MIKRVLNYFNYIWYFIAFQRINVCLSKAALGSSVRRVDLKDPLSWEFSGFSQNGEDGILDVLISKLKKPSKIAIEIGANNGFENCTAYLAIVKKYFTLMIDGNPSLVKRSNLILNHLQCYFESICKFVDRDNLIFLEKDYAHLKELDVFSIDIDGIDYYVAKKFLEMGFNPKIIIAEYNSSFGHERAVTVPYHSDYVKHVNTGGYPSYYFGCSLQSYKNLFKKYGYRFVTVESCGINAFFIKEDQFHSYFIESLGEGRQFGDNISMYFTHKMSNEQLFNTMKDFELNEVTD